MAETVSENKRAWQRAGLLLLVAALAAVLSWWLSERQLMKILGAKCYDLCFLLRSRIPFLPIPAPGPVTVVMIDAATDDYLQRPKIKPRMLWPPEFGEVLRAAADGGAKAIGLDWYFSYPVKDWDPKADELFFQAYRDTTQRGVPVILAYERIEEERSTEAFVPVYYQAVADGNIGYAHLTQDADSFVRKIELVSADGYASLSGRLAAAFLGVAPPRHDAGGSHLGDRAIPEAAARTMSIQFYGPRRSAFPTVSMAAVLKAARAGDGDQLRRWFEGRAVLIGSEEASDRRPTPFALAAGAAGELTEGVEIHAHALSTLLNGDFIRISTMPENICLVLAAALLAATGGFLFSGIGRPLAAILLMILVFALVLAGHGRGIDLPLIRAELAVMLASVGAYGVRMATQDRHRRLLEEIFSRLVSGDVLKSIVAAGAVTLTGERQEVTVLFSDIRDFTTYCEKLPPEQVVVELNEYFEEMAESIIQHGGMVNKYIGDGILALFGAPVRQTDHARHAVRCAQDMLRRLKNLNDRRLARGLAPFRMGIGIHSGAGVVGYVGTKRKMEYTAMGDTVNAASRLEGLNKDLETVVLLSHSTRELMGADIGTRSMGRHKVKGREEPIEVYTLE